MDRGAWRATVHKVAKSWTRLKRLSTAHAVSRENSFSSVMEKIRKKFGFSSDCSTTIEKP